MSQEQRLREIQERCKADATAMLQEVNISATTEIWSDNGLSVDQKKDIHGIFTDLITGKSTPEKLAKATELMKQFTGK
jgi:hypothetical protein